MKKVVKKKKQSSSKRMQKGTIGNFFVFGVLALLIVLGITAVGGTPSVTSPQSGTAVQIVTPTPGASHSNLQLETFGFTTIAPTSVSVQQPTSTMPTQPQQIQPTSPPNAPICKDDDDGVIVPSTCQCPYITIICQNGQLISSSGTYIGLPLSDFESNPCNGSFFNGRYCIGKPVIYLYPTVPTYVSVQVMTGTSGSIVVSNPHYPQGGWKNILASPGGSLQYQNQEYSELFYESSVSTFQKPTQGIVIPTAQLTQNLNEILGNLGLIGNEKQEFISFWEPKLQVLNSPYIFFSILSPSAKEAVDHVIITPKPETQIAFIAYFKPVDTPDYGSPLTLPPTPQRIGFTSVEWGGVIDGQSLLQ